MPKGWSKKYPTLTVQFVWQTREMVAEDITKNGDFRGYRAEYEAAGSPNGLEDEGFIVWAADKWLQYHISYVRDRISKRIVQAEEARRDGATLG